MTRPLRYSLASLLAALAMSLVGLAEAPSRHISQPQRSFEPYIDTMTYVEVPTGVHFTMKYIYPDPETEYFVLPKRERALLLPERPHR